jgi:cell division protein FtsZ
MSQDETKFHGARLAVIGVGGGGCNAVDTMVERAVAGVDFIALNTDAQALANSRAPQRFQLGRDLTRGLGAGANPAIGREAALADRERIAELVQGMDLVFIVAGMGGGTGTGAAPVVAEVCREVGALTVGIATTPFAFEGRTRARLAVDGLSTLKEQVDTLVIIPNDRLIALVDPNTPMSAAFSMVDEVMVRGVRAISDLVRDTGRINVDFADVRTIISDRGAALLAVGTGRGAHRTVDAAAAAISTPLLAEVRVQGARNVLISVTGPSDLTLHEVSEAATLIGDEAHEDVNLIWGWVIDDRLGDRVEVTILATGFEDMGARSGNTAWRPKTTAATRRVSPEERVSRRTGGRPVVDVEDYDVPSFFRKVE